MSSDAQQRARIYVSISVSSVTADDQKLEGHSERLSIGIAGETVENSVDQ